MAVATYASVLSLLRVVDSIQHPSHLRFFSDTAQIDALRENLCFLQHFLKVHSSTMSEDIECMVRKIPRVTYNAEILIDNYVVDQLYKELYPQNDVLGRCNIIDSIHNEIHRVIQEIVPINEALKTLRTTQRDQEQQPSKVAGINNDRRFSIEKSNKMVGFDDQLNQVLEKLIGNKPNLVMVPIVGMGGIGKTTLARSLFDHPYNLHHFSVRIWLTISLDYSVKKVLQGLLRDGVFGDKEDSEGDESSESELTTQLHQKLFGQRYLIVLDDVWSLQAWDELKWGFPDHGKGSRVIVTTRLSDIANSLDSRNNSYSMKFLDEDKSWNLFSERAFEKGGWSLELEEIGKKISKRCNGLPLLLVVVGGLLANSNMSVEYWQTVADDINSFANSAYDEYCLRILSLSYHQLPIHLKSCFLYMRHFEEDSGIKVSVLIEIWVSEGFVKPMKGKSLEEAARMYLEDLVSRNMFLIRERTKNGNIKTCGIHDLLRDLSIKESKKEQLLGLPKTIEVSGHDTEEMCAICSKRKKNMTALDSQILGSANDGKILVCSSCESTFPEFASSRFVEAVEFNKSENVPLPTTCRWIALCNVGSVSVFHTISLIWDLETLDIGCYYVFLPKELWEMPQLRHVKIWSGKLPDPVSTNNDVIVLENLQTLAGVEQLKFTEDIIRRIPNLIKLVVRYYDFEIDEEADWSCFFLQNLVRLQKLASLTIKNYRMASMDFKVIVFPCSLKKLSLDGCEIAWDDLAIISSLPNLEALKLLELSVLGDEWDPVEGEFLRLKYLKLDLLDLVHWRVNEAIHFPVLETLPILYMKNLQATPREIGELASLRTIYLRGCHKNVIDSAKLIVEEQMNYGNDKLELHVN